MTLPVPVLFLQVGPSLEKASTNPRVTVTSPQESEKNDQSNDYAAVA